MSYGYHKISKGGLSELAQKREREYKLYYSKPELQYAKEYLNLRRCDRVYTPIEKHLEKGDFYWIMYRLAKGELVVKFTVKEGILVFEVKNKKVEISLKSKGR